MLTKKDLFMILAFAVTLLIMGTSSPSSGTALATSGHTHWGEAWADTMAWPNGALYVKNYGNGPALWGENQGGGNAVRGDAYGTDSIGVYGAGDSGPGVVGRSATGRGVEGYSHGTDPWAPAVYGQNEGAGDGVYGLSKKRHGVYGITQSSNATDAGVYGTNHGAGPAIYADGDLYVTGAYRGNIGSNGGAPFPRPAYDSGWIKIAKYQCHKLKHNVGGNVNNYVVDLQFRDPYGIHNFAYGTYYDGNKERGACYDDLNNQSIQVCRRQDDIAVSEIRVRIWVYY